ncbi:MAG: hypothetical protein PCFJNLEI_03777 [Verrucomicrobiae bacterium]|nr:hypothetical protein [Verrucomicrobiae bacterium]
MRTPRSLAVVLIAVPAWLLTPLHNQIEHERQQFQYGGAPVTRELRDQIGQGMAIALLAGFRGVAADFIWIRAHDHWEKREWLLQAESIENAAKLQPRSTFFWDSGSWHMGWNIARAERIGTNDITIAQGLIRERYWHQRARSFLERGIANIPNRFDLYFKLGWLYDQKLARGCGGDPECVKLQNTKAAELFIRASEYPTAPTYVARDAARSLEKAGDLPAAYDFWVNKIWRDDRRIRTAADRTIVEREIRRLEERLDIPAPSRVFPKTSAS